MIDVFARRIVGWRVSTSMTTRFVLDALEQALWQRKPLGSKSLVHHSDRASQDLSIRHSERLVDADAGPSVGTVDEFHDTTLAESVVGLLKAEVLKPLGPWENFPNVEWATMHRVNKYSTGRLHSAIGYMPPAEAELRHLDPPETIGMVACAVERNALRQTRGGSVPDRPVPKLLMWIGLGPGNAAILEPRVEFGVALEPRPRHEEPPPDNADLVLHLPFLPARGVSVRGAGVISSPPAV